MDGARAEHNESPQTLCTQFLSNLNSVVSAEEAHGVTPATPSERWTIAVAVLKLVEDVLTETCPDETTLDEVRAILERDRRYAVTPLPPVQGRA